MEGDGGAVCLEINILQGVVALTLGFPANALIGRTSSLPGLKDDLISDDEGRIKADAELANQLTVSGLIPGQ